MSRPRKDPCDLRGRVVAARFTAEEWSRGLGFEIRYAAKQGQRILPSTLIRKAVAYYVDRRDLRHEYPPPRSRRAHWPPLQPSSAAKR